MKRCQCNLPKYETLLEVIEQHENHLEQHEIIIKLKDGICKIMKNHDTKKYDILIDTFDIKIEKTLDELIGENGSE